MIGGGGGLFFSTLPLLSPSPSPSPLSLLHAPTAPNAPNALSFHHHRRLPLRFLPAALSFQASPSPSPSPSPSCPFLLLPGLPHPLGATPSHAGVNFALYSSTATSVSLCLFTLPDLRAGKPTFLIPLHPHTNRTGHVWHLLLSPPPSPDLNPSLHLHDLLYAFRLDAHSSFLLDPYAKAVLSRPHYGIPSPPPSPSPSPSTWPPMAAMIPSPPHDLFDWQGDAPLRLPHKDLLIYEMHIRGFTNHDSSHTHHPGTYAAATQKLHHLKHLGINCIELMPCHEFNELEYFDYSPLMGHHK